MWRLIKVLIVALLIFGVVNFFLSNATEEAQSLTTEISFKFKLPPFLTLESKEFQVGYLILMAFIFGMVLTALIGGIGTFSQSKKLRHHKKKIKELEKGKI